MEKDHTPIRRVEYQKRYRKSRNFWVIVKALLKCPLFYLDKSVPFWGRNLGLRREGKGCRGGRGSGALGRSASALRGTSGHGPRQQQPPPLLLHLPLGVALIGMV